MKHLTWLRRWLRFAALTAALGLAVVPSAAYAEAPVYTSTCGPAASTGGTNKPPNGRQSNQGSAGLTLDKPGTLPGLFADFRCSIGPLWNIVLAASGVVFLVLLLVGGVQYLTSAGNDEQSKKAKTLLTEAVIGIVLVVIAWPVGVYVLRLLGVSKDVTGDSIIDPSKVLSTSSGGLNPEPGAGGFEPGTGEDATSGDGVLSRSLAFQLKNGASGVTLAYEPKATTSAGGAASGVGRVGEVIAETVRVTTDSTGRVTIPDQKPGVQFRLKDWVTSKVLFEGTVNEDPSSNTHLIDPTKTAEDLVRVRIIANHHLTQKQLRNFTFALQNTQTGITTYISTSDDPNAPYAEPLLEPGVTYKIVEGGLSGDVSKYQDTTVAVPAGPKGTENPASTFSFTVTPLPTFTEDLPSDIEDFQDNPAETSPQGTAT